MSCENRYVLRLRQDFLGKIQHHRKGKLVFEDTTGTRLCREQILNTNGHTPA